MLDRNEEVIGLLDGVRDGKYIVKGYSSEWVQKGPGNIRKMIITIEDTNFDKHGKRIT
jgi:hypothetical protein